MPGDLFVAMDGARYDGHEYAGHAIARGAAGVLAERYLQLSGSPVCIVEDTRRAYGELCQALAGWPARHLKTIGVTGTAGKRAAAALIASVLAEAGIACGLLSTLGYHDGVESEEATLAIPSAPVLANWLARMRANGCSHAVLEVSSEALTQSRIAGVELASACLTDIARDRLDDHASVAQCRRAKARIFNHLAADGFAVVNTDDAAASALVPKINHPVLAVGLGGDAQITATRLERYRSEQTFMLTAGSQTSIVRTMPIGDDYITSCLVAAAVGLAHGLDLTTIVRGIERLQHIPGRLEPINCGQPFGVFVDDAQTPRSLASSLDTLREVTDRKIICVFGAEGNRDRGARPIMGRAVEQRADTTIVTSNLSRGEDPVSIAGEILAGFEQPALAELILDRPTAIRRALAIAEEGDTVLIAGKGQESHGLSDSECLEDDDRHVARSWLYNIADDRSPHADARRMMLGNH